MPLFIAGYACNVESKGSRIREICFVAANAVSAYSLPNSDDKRNFDCDSYCLSRSHIGWQFMILRGFLVVLQFSVLNYFRGLGWVLGFRAL